MGKKQLLKCLDIMPEFIFFFLVFEKYCADYRFVCSIILFYYYFIVGIYQERGIAIKKKVALFLVPVILILLPPFFSIYLSLYVLIISIYASIRIGWLYKHPFTLPYTMQWYFIDVFFLILGAFLFVHSFIILFAILLKSILLIECNVTPEDDAAFEDKGTFFVRIVLFCTAAVPLIRILPDLFQFLDRFTTHLYTTSFYIVEKLKLITTLIKGTAMYIKLVLAALTFLNHHLFITGLSFSAITLICAYKSLKLKYALNSIKEDDYYHVFLGDDEVDVSLDKSKAIYEEQIIKLKSKSKREVDTVSEIRGLYRKVLKWSFKRGYVLKSNSTSRELGIFLARSISNKREVESLNGLYEIDRYGNSTNETVAKFRSLYQKLFTRESKNMW